MKGNVIYVAISCALGIVTAYGQGDLFLILLCIGYGTYSFYQHQRYVFYSCCLSFALFFCYFLYIDSTNQSTISPETTSFQGEVTSIPIVNGDKVRFSYEINEEKVQLSYKIKNEDEKKRIESVSVGTVCRTSGALKDPPLPRNENSFDYKTYLYRQSIHYTFEASELDCVKGNSDVFSLVASFRQKSLIYVKEHFPSEVVGFVQALIYGERGQLDEEVEGWYEDLGLVHLLAISGSHITLITLAFYSVLLRIGLTREKATIALLCVLPVYMLLAGASPSVVRATGTSMIVLASFFLIRKVVAIDVLGLSFIGMLIYKPYYLFEVGFLLSFSVSLALILSANYLNKGQFSPIMNMLFISGIAQLVALPITLYNFYVLSPYSVLLNLFFVPLICFCILPLSFIALLSSLLFEPLGELCMGLLSVIINVSNSLLDLVSSFPFATLIFGQPTVVWICLFYISIVSFFICVEQGNKKYSEGTLAIVLLLFCFQYVSSDSALKVTFLDVGQGDSIIIELPNRGQVYVIDTGGSLAFEQPKWKERNSNFDVGKETVLPYLKSRGIREIDKLIITHGDADHGAQQTVFYKE